MQMYLDIQNNKRLRRTKISQNTPQLIYLINYVVENASETHFYFLDDVRNTHWIFHPFMYVLVEYIDAFCQRAGFKNHYMCYSALIKHAYPKRYAHWG